MTIDQCVCSIVCSPFAALASPHSVLYFTYIGFPSEGCSVLVHWKGPPILFMRALSSPCVHAPHERTTPILFISAFPPMCVF